MRPHILMLIAMAAILAAGCMEGADRAEALLPAATDANPSPFVHADGVFIRDGQGRPIRLRGVNLGGWFLWEGWMWGGVFQTETDMMRRLAEALGPEEAESFRTEIHRRMIAEADIARIAQMGFNVVRLPLTHWMLDDTSGRSEYPKAGWDLLDRVLGWCEKYGVYAVLDLHSAPGGQSFWFICDPDPGHEIWTDPANAQRTVDLWQAIARRYKDRRIVAAYDLLNEPLPPSGKALVAFYRRLIAAVRAVDPDHMIMLEGGLFGVDFSMFPGPLAPNTIYSFHMYNWVVDDRRLQLAGVRRLALRHQMPLWCGEFGESSYDMIRTTVALYEDPRRLVSGWCYWPWKRVPNRAPGLESIHPSKKWLALVDWVSGRSFSRRPTRQEAAAAASEFLMAVDIEWNTEDAEMVEILTSPGRAEAAATGR
jgi:hypothetical protein